MKQGIYEHLEENGALYILSYFSESIGTFYNLVRLYDGKTMYTAAEYEEYFKKMIGLKFNYLGKVESINIIPEPIEIKNYKV